MGVGKVEILKYLSDTRAHYTAYHNHKEVSAWAGVVLYVIVCTQVALMRDELLESDSLVRAVGVMVGLLFLAVLTYLHAQFRLRREAANYLSALLYLSAAYLVRDDKGIKPSEWELEVKTDAGHHSPQVLPRVVLSKALEMDRVGHGTRRRLEFAAYFIVSLSSLGVALRLWFR